MRFLKRTIAVLLGSILGIGTLGMFVGCGNKVANDDQTLQIYISNYGYGYLWLDDIIEAFKQEEWVKEKYPNLNIPTPTNNSVRTYAVDQVLSGSTNTYDLLFSTSSGASSYEKKYGDSTYFAELSDVYNSVVPGEDVYFWEKMDDSFYTMSVYERLDGTTGYYAVPWVAGMQGMLYNQTMFNEHENWFIPNTTDELKTLCEIIVSDQETPFVFASKEGYWTSMMYKIWWAQYQGVEEYNRYFQGQVKDGDGYRYSRDITKQTGRLRSLEVIESLISYADETSRRYIHANVNTDDFTQAQSKFLLREGAMQPNGDWFDVEMRDLASEGITDVITFMKTPVISSITEQCTTINGHNGGTKDEELSALINAIDNNDDRLEGDGYSVNQPDYNKVKEARNMILPIGNHNAFIPEYATAKELAKDFLRFLATDKACNLFIESTKGASLPFEYNCETEDLELFSTLTQIQKDRLKLESTGNYLIHENTYKTVYYGGIRAMSPTVEVSFTARNPQDQKTAQVLYDAEIRYLSESMWDSVLINSGLK